jgi:hypothetical protein
MVSNEFLHQILVVVCCFGEEFLVERSCVGVLIGRGISFHFVNI